ncbi:MAG: DUF3168 domain-containing protein [Chloroflexi bacterium]|mgnify:CR=1 FL=1|nr:DUF3168 domain-containing protein [Chloroflexota bacterium]OJV86952.1 MAG: hypothetical protein BGO39_28530 [Chloroflexi bacterium 54-19]
MAIAPDPMLALIAYLLADTDVASLAGARVYGAELPEGASQPVLPPTVLIQDAGGLGDRGYSDQYNWRVDVFAYGPDPEQAKQLQMACIGALRKLERRVVNGTMLYSASKEAGPNPGRSQTSLWPFSFSVWSVETSYLEVV